MYILYSGLLFLSFLFYIPLYFLKLKILRNEPLFLKERLGLKLSRKRHSGHRIWLHAVSVGEVLSLRQLIQRIKEKHPDWSIVFSTLTNTGMKIARKEMKQTDLIFLCHLISNLS